ncbi:MAG: coproporphyrinogen dehydrogenase HemZ [Eubacterium sp.]
MIEVDISGTEFSYDMKALAMVFYPEKECRVVEHPEVSTEDGYSIKWQMDGKKWEKLFPNPYTKNQIKKEVYEYLKTQSGKELPWGILTGIRPAKIPLRLMMQGQEEAAIRDILKEEYFCRDDKVKLAMDVAKKEFSLTQGMQHERCANVYIGIPFCPTICAYCSFSSFPAGRYRDKMDAYLDALEKEMTQCKEWLAGKQMVSVYVGGGTPTSLSEEQFERLMAMTEKYLPMEQSKEFTVEAGRPDSITEGKLRSMKTHGVTRISINPQSMKEHTLELLGRKHTVEEIREKFMLARTLGFDNINMDLIAGLPEETLEDFKETLREVEALKPDSITVHTLVIKRASRLRKEQLEQGGEMREEDACIEPMQKEAEQFCRVHGYSRIICTARKIRHIRREIPIRKMWLMQNREKNVCITYLLWRNCSRSWHLAAEVRPRSYFRRKTGWNE